jgi:PAS domain S-box-containing protein
VLKNAPIRWKLFLTVLALAVPALILVGVLSYIGGRAAVERATLDHLTSVRASKANQIEEYFNQISSLARTFAKDRMIIDAMADFDDAHQVLLDVELPPEQRDAVIGYYNEEFLPRLEANSDAPVELAGYLPTDDGDLYLQYHYIVTNPNPLGEKDLVDDAGDGSLYTDVHGMVHPVLRDFVHEFGFHDLFLINGSGHIVYTVSKEVDLGTNLLDGPYQDSNLAMAFQAAQYDYLSDEVQLVDFAPHEPSFGEPSSFMAAPIVDGAWLLGVLAFQMPVGEIDDVMTSNRNWEIDGLGETGETYLVGTDFKMRSNSRFLLEDPAGYIEAAEKAGASPAEIRRIRNFETTILVQDVRTAASIAALIGETETTATKDYRGVEVLSSYAPLNIKGVTWAILSEIDTEEAFTRIRVFSRNLVLRLAGLLAIVLVAAWFLSRRFVAPIVELDNAARGFAEGEEDVEVPVTSGDELGGLAQSFNQMVSAIRQKTNDLKKTAEELEGVSSVILRWDTDGRILFMNDFGLELFGFTAEELIGQPLAGSIVPGSEVVDRNIRRMIDEIATDPAKYEIDETENQCKNGDWIWMAWRNTPILADDGSLREILTIGIDITERKRTEGQLRKLSRAVEQSSSSVVITDLAGNIEYANPKFTEITGYALEEVMGQNPRVLKSGSQPQEFYADLWATITSGREWHGEFCNRRKNGELYWESASISPIRDASGEITHYVAIKDDITERRRIEQEIAQQKQLLENTLESLTHPFYVVDAEDYSIKIANSAARALGESGVSTCHALTHKSPTPCDSTEHACPMVEVKRTKKPVILEHVHEDAEGNPRIMEVNGYPIFDDDGNVVQMIEYSIDITERKEFEEQLKKSEDRIRTMVDNIPGVVYRCLMDDAWTMLFISDEIEVLSGYPASDFLGEDAKRTFASIMHEDDIEPVAENAQKAVDERVPYTNEYRVIDKDGNVHWVYARGKAIYDEDGTPLYLDGTIFDVTEKKVMELQLEDARDAAESASRAKSTFLANMSHELRTPMNAIIGYSEMLAEDAEDEGHDEMVPDLEKINAAGKHLLALINDILDLSKIEAGRMDLFLETFDLRQMLDEAVATVMPLITKNENKLETEFADDLGNVRVDLTKLRQALFNLLSNAAKFTDGGTITLAAKKGLRDGQEWLELSVADTGIGIAADKLDAVFEEFSQADDSTTRDYGGTGLGLPISRRFCQMMGGDITISSKLGKGTTFTIELPSRIDALDAAKSAAKPEQPEAKKTAPGVRPILVVDDDPNSRELLQRTLESEGFSVVTASTGEEGLELARELKPSLMTLDVLMPSMDGWSVLQEVKANPELENIPVMMISIAGDKDLGYTLGAVECLTKPVDRDKLRQLASQYASPAGGGRALVVDDDQGIRSLFQRALADDGWTVDEAENGAIALDLAGKNRPDLVLLDLMMPVMDGFEFVMHYRKLEGCTGTPIIVVTAKDLDQNERDRLLGGVERIVEKGALTRQQLLKQVRELVSQHGVTPGDKE